MIEDGMRILFQGDSITDAGRDRSLSGPNQPAALGWGYAAHAAARLLSDHPRRGFSIWNRGVGGDQVTDLEARWMRDCLEFEPDLLSILIGVNDSWRYHDKGPDAGVDLERYETTLAALVETARERSPGIRVVLCEPFVLPCGAVSEAWFPEFDDRRGIVRRLAEAGGHTFVPFQEIMNAAQREAPPAYWAEDGVHPTPAGHWRMADAWMAHVLGA